MIERVEKGCDQTVLNGPRRVILPPEPLERSCNVPLPADPIKFSEDQPQMSVSSQQQMVNPCVASDPKLEYRGRARREASSLLRDDSAKLPAGIRRRLPSGAGLGSSKPTNNILVFGVAQLPPRRRPSGRPAHGFAALRPARSSAGPVAHWRIVATVHREPRSGSSQKNGCQRVVEPCAQWRGVVPLRNRQPDHLPAPALERSRERRPFSPLWDTRSDKPHFVIWNAAIEDT